MLVSNSFRNGDFHYEKRINAIYSKLPDCLTYTCTYIRGVKVSCNKKNRHISASKSSAKFLKKRCKKNGLQFLHVKFMDGLIVEQPYMVEVDA